ncbi:hypothetical protein HYV89_04200 [Candidatus Woesearchaeota archaeon]|nr:hypothetical protein [Candidatus Woesearchaeota archaeon]
MPDEYQGRSLEELAKRVKPVLHDLFKDREILSRREILGSFCNYKELGDLTTGESVSVLNYLISDRVIVLSQGSFAVSRYRLNKS